MAAKRTLDVSVAVAALALLLPLFILVAIAIKFESKGPVLFLQRRTGRDSRAFRIVKFRTMTVQENGHHVIQATSGDRRVTRVGGFLRRTSLDELPQLLNVLTGSMSLVGPRPHALSHDDYFSRRIDGYGRRFCVRPGLTGLAQVSGLRGEIHTLDCMARRVSADLDYIERWSLLLDVQLIWRTLCLIGRDQRAY